MRRGGSVNVETSEKGDKEAVSGAGVAREFLILVFELSVVLLRKSLRGL